MKPTTESQHDPNADAVQRVEARRRLLLRGLGKGSAVLAAMTPMASHATRKYILANPVLPNGQGYCSCSGWHSAAISAAPDGGFKTCVGYKPSHFFVEKPQISFTTSSFGGNTTRNAIRAACGFPSNLAGNNAATSLANGFVTIAPAGTPVAVYIPLTPFSLSPTANKIRKITPSADFPTIPGVTRGPLAPFNSASIFNAGPSNPLLYQLTLNEDEAFFLSAYLSALKDPGGFEVGDVPFNASYVVANYSTPGAAAFFRALCTLN